MFKASFRVGDYVARHPFFSKRYRTQMVNWMVVCQQDFELTHETLYTAIKTIDLFLDRTNRLFQRGDWQLVASTALFIATKYEVMLSMALIN